MLRGGANKKNPLTIVSGLRVLGGTNSAGSEMKYLPNKSTRDHKGNNQVKFEQRSLIESIDKSTCVDQFSESLSKRFSRHALIFRHLHGCKIRLRMQQCTVMHPRFLGVANFDISRSGLRKTREMTLQNAYGIQSASCAARCIPPPSLSDDFRWIAGTC